MDTGLERFGKDVIYLGVMILLTLFVTVTSFSYAVLTKDLVGEKTYAIQIGMFDFTMQEENNSIRLLNAYPMTDEEGQALAPYKFSITNTGDYEEDYKVSLIEAEEEKQACQNCTFLDPSKLRYALTVDGEVKKAKAVESTTVLDSGSLDSGKTRNYELKVWLNIDATVEEENKFYYGKIKVEAVQAPPNAKSMVSRKAFASENLGENCKTYNDGVDTFLVGQCSQNYVWYSGKLWRVVLKNNETGAVKMVTDNAMTAISYNNRGNAEFENSHMDQWLTQEFLPTLHDYQDYLVVDSTWDATLDGLDTPSRPVGTTTVQRTVGLLNAYEYYTTYNKSDSLATPETGYLNNGTWWWLMTPDSTWRTQGVTRAGGLTRSETVEYYSSRPSVNLQADIHIIDGSGTMSDSYRLEGDEQEIVGGTTLLSTRYSGEYVIFNDELYRIVGVEDGKTKIIAVDKPEELASNKFHNSKLTNFANADIKTDLETYYQDNVEEPYKSMIEPNTTWYLGVIDVGINYKASICKTVDAKTSASTCERTDISTTASIGLPRAGEIFTSQITRGTKNYFWTLTPYDNTRLVRGVGNNDGGLTFAISTESLGARPSMYLKSNVVIASTNTGDGTYEHPYDIELGA